MPTKPFCVACNNGHVAEVNKLAGGVLITSRRGRGLL
jgi:hypothetical protein